MALASKYTGVLWGWDHVCHTTVEMGSPFAVTSVHKKTKTDNAGDGAADFLADLFNQWRWTKCVSKDQLAGKHWI